MGRETQWLTHSISDRPGQKDPPHGLDVEKRHVGAAKPPQERPLIHSWSNREVDAQQQGSAAVKLFCYSTSAQYAASNTGLGKRQSSSNPQNVPGVHIAA